MTEPLFDPEKCNVPEVPKLDFDFVSECSIAEPPPPIFDCQPPLIPRDPPPPLCPIFETSAAVRSGIARDGCPVDNEATGAMTVTQTENDPCRFFIDFDLNVPIPKVPCPTFASGTVTVGVDYSGCIPGPTGVITIDKEVIPGDCKTQDSCRFTIDLDLQIPIPPPPCPEITATGVISMNDALDEPTMAFTVEPSTVTDGCETKCKFDFDIDIEIPDFCPEIKATGTISKEEGREDPTMVFSVEKDPEKCKFDFDLDIIIPDICPEIKATGTIVKDRNRENPTMVFSVDKDTENCKFDFDLDIIIPAPCPDFKATGTAYYNDTPTAVFTITPDPDPDKCKFDLDFEVGFPCVDFTSTEVNIYPSSTPEGYLDFTRVGDDCKFDVVLDLGLPVCVPEFTTEHNIFCTPGRDQITCTKFEIAGPGPSDCKYTARLDIEMPCITPNKFEEGTVAAAWAATCTGDPTCDLTIDPPDEDGVQKIHIDIKIPRPVEYTGGTINLGSYGSGNISIDASDPCNRQINATISLTTTACPEGGGGASGPTGNFFKYMPGGNPANAYCAVPNQPENYHNDNTPLSGPYATQAECEGA